MFANFNWGLVAGACFLVTSLAGADTVSVSSLELSRIEQGYGSPRADASTSGKPIAIGGRKFEKGIGTHAVSDFFIDLKGEAESFSAWVGVDDETNGAGKVEFSVIGDGRPLWKSPEMKGKDAAKLAEVDLKGIKLLQLHVGAKNIGLAHADWADATIVFHGAKPRAVRRPEPPTVPLADDWKRSQSMNAGWRFLRLDVANAPEAGFENPVFDDSKWENATLPHTAKIEDRVDRFPFQGICWDRHSLTADAAWKGKKVFVEFGAAMQIAEVWVNGKQKVRHLGGYLPFTVDVTDDLRYDQPNVVAARLDNRDTEECPPGKPTKDLDFNYPGGLYRGVRLVVTDPIHISDPVSAGIEAGGGVFVQCKNVTEAKATVTIKTHVVNEDSKLIPSCAVLSILRDPQGREVARAKSLPLMISGSSGHHFNQELELANPMLWHPDHPSLYTLESQVIAHSHVTDRIRTRVGVRTFTLGSRLLINGKEFHMVGSNRHQEYPYLEYAISPNGAYRDAQKIREGGFNHIRLSHYPQDPAFLDACDELGILVQAAIPGWQIFRATEPFVTESFQNIRDLIRRDRNHPSVIFWEPNLNETHGDHFAQWQRTAHEIAHAEFPGDECFTFGDPYPEKEGWAWDVRGFAREYGDFGFGGNESTSRHLRGEGEQPQLQQAWNYQWCFNDMSKNYDDPKTNWLGCATWVMFDYNRGYHPKPCLCGMMDILRLPKFVYYLFQSQRDPALIRSDVDSGPMLFFANYWTTREAPAKVVVYSNCDEVELAVNGKLIRRQKPDNGPDTRYSSQKGFNYATVGNDHNSSGGNPFDGGNSKHLAHPPFTFADVPFQPGTLTATGYLNGKPVMKREVRTPGKPAALKLVFDTAGRELAADGADAVFVRALVLDANGTVVPGNDTVITYSVNGPARLIGPNPIQGEAGIASILLQAGLKAGPITVTVNSPGLPPVTASITSRDSTEGCGMGR